LLIRGNNYSKLVEDFNWIIPDLYNIGVDACDQQARGDGSVALVFVDERGATQRFSFDQLRVLSNRFANVLTADGLALGDRVAVLLPQSPETAVAHLGTFKAGMVSVPLFPQLGPEGIEQRLSDCGAKAIVTDTDGLSKLDRVRDRLADLLSVYVVGSQADTSSGKRFTATLQQAAEDFRPVSTRADDPAIVIFTSGTEGRPKGVVHAHRALLGSLSGFELAHDFPLRGELVWTSANWAWVFGIFPALAALCHGMPILMHSSSQFDPQRAMSLMSTYEVRHAILTPTALRLIRLASGKQSRVRLRSIATGGETLGGEILDWVKEGLGVTPHEGYAQTESVCITGNNSRVFPVRPGSIGRAVPGHNVQIVDELGNEMPRGTVGIMAVRQPDPATFLGYWNDLDATATKFAGQFLLTGDLASQDEEGYFWYLGRSDDMITSAGHRIGPGEIENCIMTHPAVSLAAVVGVPDPICTHKIKAWIVPREGYLPSESLAREIQVLVRARLAPYQCPHYISFADSLPLTNTGKPLRGELRARG
jgi:acetyl-CoA synthetase